MVVVVVGFGVVDEASRTCWVVSELSFFGLLLLICVFSFHCFLPFLDFFFLSVLVCLKVGDWCKGLVFGELLFL